LAVLSAAENVRETASPLSALYRTTLAPLTIKESLDDFTTILITIKGRCSAFFIAAALEVNERKNR